ncbi:hypothetical protein BDQ17DRAFT_1331356 [Cyathus striatus]|nr:hypothetical protein BDQ17DRAFT_1331356 [Cyathus striatus]
MHFTNAFLVTSFLSFISTASGASVNFYSTKEATCGGSPSLEYRFVACNTCVDPALDWWGAEVFDIASNQRVSMHNQNSCTPASQVGQWYGNVCALAGATALRSVWVACAGQKLDNNETENANAKESAENGSVTFVSLE